MQAQAQQVLERCKQAFEKARELYGLDLSNVQIRFDLKGRAAGQAYRRNFQYGVRFNRDMLNREAFDHVLNETVPHEVAHIVCFMNPNLGRNHDSGWARVCRSLGGTGARTHKEEFVLGKGTTYEYITDRGHKVRFGDRHHNHVQNGGTLRYRKGLGNVTQFCTYSIVGVGGRTLANPIVKQAPNHPSNIEAGLQKIRAYAEQEAARRAAARTTQGAVAATAAATPAVNRAQPPKMRGESTAVISWRVMLSAFNRGMSYNDIINLLITANGYDQEKARLDFERNAPKVGIPASFYN